MVDCLPLALRKRRHRHLFHVRHLGVLIAVHDGYEALTYRYDSLHKILTKSNETRLSRWQRRDCDHPKLAENSHTLSNSKNEAHGPSTLTKQRGFINLRLRPTFLLSS